MHWFVCTGSAQKPQRGFTIIELLVVIAIIGLIASITLASLQGARAKARDARRMSDLNQIRNALELYANANGNTYPSTGGNSNWHGNCATYGSFGTLGAGGWIPDLAPAYIAQLPLDPSPVPPSYCYLYTSDGTNYKFLIYGTFEGTPPAFLNDPAGRSSSAAVYSPDAGNW